VATDTNTADIKEQEGKAKWVGVNQYPGVRNIVRINSYPEKDKSD
jgi:hypothetical protein